MNLGDDFEALEAALLESDFLRHVLDRHRQTAHQLIAEAARDWLDAGCPRYNDHEVSCAAAVVGQLVKNIDRAKQRSLQPFVTLETGAWTEAHLDGRLDPSTVPRPDVVLWLGLQQEGRLNIECKRLLRGMASAGDYVRDGLCRFLNGRYPVDEGVGTMVAFLLDRSPTTASAEISAAIRDILSRDEPLALDGSVPPPNAAYRSTHRDATVGVVELLHLLLEVA